MYFPAGYLILCFILALIGRRQKFGFWGLLFCSLLFTPLVGLLIIAGSGRQRTS